MKISGEKSVRRLVNVAVILGFITILGAVGLWMVVTVKVWDFPIPRLMVAITSVIAPLSLVHFLYKSIQDYKVSEDRVTLELDGDSLYINGKKLIGEGSTTPITLVGFTGGAHRYAILFHESSHSTSFTPLKDYVFSASIDELISAVPKGMNIKKQTFLGL
ncbi:MAG: hypothetical protein HLUCCO02_13035 [Idiomarinaceae bacterium HL-53]|nr:MAG: hypothetical protein HLUCCO02_13035 [Idiomarinaceae bacterium HL-53]CUS47646.1 hypothetical protein Ga0003345_0579 [Idiomarinaceae bacterium HL-53]